MKKAFVLLSLSALFFGCASATSRNGTGLLYTEITDSIVATSNAVSTKMGTTCATNILSMVSTGDMSIETAKKNAGITKVASVDYTANSILGFWEKTCVIVRGE